jgi:hypothetical protein
MATPRLFGLPLNELIQERPSPKQIQLSQLSQQRSVGIATERPVVSNIQPEIPYGIRSRCMQYAIAAHCAGVILANSEDPRLYACHLVSQAQQYEYRAWEIVNNDTSDMDPVTLQELTPMNLNIFNNGRYLVAIKTPPPQNLQMTSVSLPYSREEPTYPNDDSVSVINYIIEKVNSAKSITEIGITRKLFDLLENLAVGEPIAFPPVEVPVLPGFNYRDYDVRRSQLIKDYLINGRELNPKHVMGMVNHMFSRALGALPTDVPSQFIAFFRVTPDNIDDIITNHNILDNTNAVVIGSPQYG